MESLETMKNQLFNCINQILLGLSTLHLLNDQSLKKVEFCKTLKIVYELRKNESNRSETLQKFPLKFFPPNEN